ncbi:hypothetical protein KL928_001913 [Ogataea angusta]|uniref:Stretch-activated cation channel MID1 n=1 Tax=Pichia angusta TaxID=870730 RepID=A0AAN6I6V8_PICAN|nr:uncharacterized protein KL928_001913 [Ogataea angusta]KAG7820476.1 hypothetical protein KL928_001913 [Ogataea angusta]
MFSIYLVLLCAVVYAQGLDLSQYEIDVPGQFTPDNLFERSVERSLPPQDLYGLQSVSSSIGFNQSQTYAFAFDSKIATSNVTLKISIDSRPTSWRSSDEGLVLYYDFGDDLTDIEDTTKVEFRNSEAILTLNETQLNMHSLMFARLISNGCAQCKDDQVWTYTMEISAGSIYFNYTGENLISVVDVDDESVLLSGADLWSNPHAEFVLSLYNDANYTSEVLTQPIDNSTVTGDRNLIQISGLQSNATYFATFAEQISGNDVTLVHQRFNFTLRDSQACKIIHNLEFCKDVAYAVPASAALVDGAQTVDELAALYDNYSSSLYVYFDYALQQIPCDTELDSRYSPIVTCDDCRQSYRQWLCAVTIPRCSTLDAPLYKLYNESEGRTDFIAETIQPPLSYYEVLPCLNICQAIVRDCPPDFGFKCPSTSALIKRSYGDDKYLDEGDTYLACNSFTFEYTSAASRLIKVPWILLILSLVVLL